MRVFRFWRSMRNGAGTDGRTGITMRSSALRARPASMSGTIAMDLFATAGGGDTEFGTDLLDRSGMGYSQSEYGVWVFDSMGRTPKIETVPDMIARLIPLPLRSNPRRRSDRNAHYSAHPKSCESLTMTTVAQRGSEEQNSRGPLPMRGFRSRQSERTVGPIRR